MNRPQIEIGTLLEIGIKLVQIHQIVVYLFTALDHRRSHSYSSEKAKHSKKYCSHQNLSKLVAEIGLGGGEEGEGGSAYHRHPEIQDLSTLWNTQQTTGRRSNPA